MYIPAFSTKLWFSRIYLFAVFTYKVRHRSGSRAHWKKYWILFKNKFRFSPFKIKLTFSASALMSKHNGIKCYPKNCKRARLPDRYNSCKKRKEPQKVMQHFFRSFSSGPSFSQKGWATSYEIFVYYRVVVQAIHLGLHRGGKIYSELGSMALHSAVCSALLRK